MEDRWNGPETGARSCPWKTGTSPPCWAEPCEWSPTPRARRSREYCLRSFDNPKDLRIARAARSSERTIADWISSPPGGSGVGRDPIATLIEAGRKYALEAGIARPSIRQLIHYGLAHHDHSIPVRLPDEKVPELIRAVLFDGTGASDQVDPETEAIVVDRLIAALHNHLEEPASAFNAWLLDRGSTIVKQIALQKTAPGGVLTSGEVRQALLQLGWKAHEYVADCIGYLMQAVARTFPDPLSDRELRIFKQMHLPQPHLGGLPLILLGDHLESLEGVLPGVCEDPQDPARVGALHRLLQYHVILNLSRREADREIKRTGDLSLDERRDSGKGRRDTHPRKSRCRSSSQRA
jgi:hypothetical protein